MIWAFSEAVARRLGAWAVLSLGIGAGLYLTGGPFWRAFALQAVIWGLIDGGLAAFGLRQARRRARPPEAEARALRRLLWINAGLDLLYIAGGAALAGVWSGGAADLQGHGWGIVVQGVFLLVFDVYHGGRVPAEPRLAALRFFEGAEHRTFLLEAGPAAPAVLLIHGFPGTPTEVRAVGESLHAAGWTAHGLLLPGFGPDLTNLPYRRWPDWTAAVRAALADLERAGRPVMVAGFSFGGALALAAAAEAQPAGLILLAPFVWAEPLWARLVLNALRPFLPYAVRPYRHADLGDARFQHGLRKMAPGVDWADPAVRAGLRDLAVPLTVLAELRETRRALAAARRVTTPALVVHGAVDPVARPAAVRRLARQLAGPVTVAEVPAGHDLLEPASPGWPAVEQAVLAFAADVRARVDAAAEKEPDRHEPVRQPGT